MTRRRNTYTSTCPPEKRCPECHGRGMVPSGEGFDEPCRECGGCGYIYDDEGQPCWALSAEYAEALNDIADELDLPTGVAPADIVLAVRNRLALGIHTCHAECQRPLCVAHREIDRLNKAWDSDRAIFRGALQLLKEAGLAPDSAALIEAARRMDASLLNIPAQTPEGQRPGGCL